MRLPDLVRLIGGLVLQRLGKSHLSVLLGRMILELSATIHRYGINYAVNVFRRQV